VRTAELTEPRAIDAVRGLLSPTEHAKHQAYRFERHRHEYLVTRAVERAVLSACLGCPPAGLAFARNEYGRPELVPGSPLRFNLTNTVAMVACAVAVGRELGVDAEPLARGDDILGIAETVFTSYERATLESLELTARRRRAVELWTLKEAYMKARGMGMSLPVKELEIVFDAEGVTGLRVFGAVVDDPARWALATREVGDHLVSVCVERSAGEPIVDVVHADVAAMLGA
jgi:4'-phosphopantetheinyl transferase